MKTKKIKIEKSYILFLKVLGGIKKNSHLKLLSFRQVSENNNFVNAIIKYQIL